MHTCGLTVTDEAWCWGGNTVGQLGDGGTSDAPAPVHASPALTFQAIAAGGGHTCGIAGDGVAYCWGDNRAGQLGDGTTIARLAPVRVIGQAEPTP
jgi:alpha-tubulin suppressor-like RCC1 family protein